MYRRYNIAGLITDIEYFSPTLEKQSAAYKYDGDEQCHVKIKVPEKFMESQIKNNPQLSPDELEYIWTGYDFSRQIIKHGAFVMHSSAVAYEGYAYMFSADCGTGKSTHTSFWQKNFGEDKAVILNDDKPIIIKKDGIFCASGTPWSGKTDKNTNICIPIAGISVLERGEKNSISSITPIEAFRILYSQTYHPSKAEETDILLSLFNDFLANVRAFRLKCNMSCEAAQTSYNAMKPLI
ncbi:MAG: hypothetical protein IJO52_01880 [Clostridia bacterium]|nr:hypothetical protein [Clostridia bacterium]